MEQRTPPHHHRLCPQVFSLLCRSFLFFSLFLLQRSTLFISFGTYSCRIYRSVGAKGERWKSIKEIDLENVAPWCFLFKKRKVGTSFTFLVFRLILLSQLESREAVGAQKVLVGFGPGIVEPSSLHEMFIEKKSWAGKQGGVKCFLALWLSSMSRGSEVR